MKQTGSSDRIEISFKWNKKKQEGDGCNTLEYEAFLEVQHYSDSQQTFREGFASLE